MYESGEADVISIAEGAAKSVAVKDREQYRKFLAEIEKFAEERRLVLGGEHATQLLLGDNVSPLEWGQIDLYSPSAVDHAKRLADALYNVDSNGLGYYTTMTTKIAGNEFIVSVNARDLAKVVSLRVRTMPIQRRAMFYEPGRPFCMPPEIQLIQIYGELCNPSRAVEWKELLTIEAQLRTMTLKGLRPKIARVKGGDDAETPDQAIDVFRGAIANDYAKGEKRTQVGRVPPQFVAASLEAEKAAVGKLAEKAGVAISVAEESCEIPMEPRLRRLSVYVAGKSGESREVLRVFNAAAFELVPYEETRGKKVGNVLVRMRFALIEVWSVQLKVRTKELAQETGKRSLLGAVEKYEDAAKEYARTLEEKDALDKLFPLDSSLGQVEDLDLARKRFIQEQTKKSAARYPPYYPTAKRAG